MKGSFVNKTSEISVFAPVYNTEKHSKCCLDSLLNQTFTDSLGFISGECVKKDNKISVFHKEGTGVNSVRNLGLRFFCGEWRKLKRKNIVLSEKIKVFYPFKIVELDVITKFFARLIMCFQLFFFLRIRAKKTDQVWRPSYSPHLPTYFLDFVEENKEVKKIAYVASFGVDTWEFSKSGIRMAKRLAPLFDVISVREDSGVTLCENHLGMEVKHALDPTLLLAKEDYIALFEAENEPRSEGDLFTYILDAAADKSEIIAQVANELSLNSFAVQAKTNKRSRKNYKHHIDDLIVPPVTKWLRAFYDAKFVITDSFHGCVFSILFNKPFIVLSNESRGQARFTSLLSLFNLTERLSDLTIKELPDINWDEVNEIKRKEVESSLNYLEINLY